MRGFEFFRRVAFAVASGVLFTLALESVLRWVNPEHGLATLLFVSLFNPGSSSEPDFSISLPVLMAAFCNLFLGLGIATCALWRPRREVLAQQALLPVVVGIAAAGLASWVYLLGPRLPVPEIRPDLMPTDLRWARVDATAQSVGFFGWGLGSLGIAALALRRPWLRSALLGAVCGGAAGVVCALWSWWFWPAELFEMHVSGFFSRELSGLFLGGLIGLTLPVLRWVVTR